MDFRSLLLCVLVSYVAVIAASPLEGPVPENEKVEVGKVEVEKVEVENVESSTQDSALTELEETSDDNGASDQDSEEHPESAGLMNSRAGRRRPPSRPLGRPLGRRTSGGRSRPTSRTHPSSRSRPSRKPKPSTSRKTKPTSKHNTHGHNDHKDHKRRGPSHGKDKHEKKHKTRNEHDSGSGSLVHEIGVQAAVSGISAVAQESVGATFDGLKNIGKGPQAGDDDYYKHPEDDNYDDDDSSNNDVKCPEEAKKYCFEKNKSSDPKECFAHYKC